MHIMMLSILSLSVAARSYRNVGRACWRPRLTDGWDPATRSLVRTSVLPLGCEKSLFGFAYIPLDWNGNATLFSNAFCIQLTNLPKFPFHIMLIARPFFPLTCRTDAATWWPFLANAKSGIPIVWHDWVLQTCKRILEVYSPVPRLPPANKRACE